MRLSKIKRPGGVFWYDLDPVAADGDGIWLRGLVGAAWGAPHDGGTLPVEVVVLLAPGRPWVAWWVDDPADRRLEIDVCLPPEPAAAGWSYVDLELDPKLHAGDGRVEIEDWDEYAESCRNGVMSPAEAELARATAEDLAQVLRDGQATWQQHGWDLLNGAITGRYAATWTEDVAACLDLTLADFEQRHGYPPGDHLIGGPAAPSELPLLRDLPPDLRSWYATVREVRLPDVANGYFIHPPEMVAGRDGVREIRGRHADAVVVFGSDGGGTLFAYGAHGIYRLPAGEITAGVYTSDDPRYTLIATRLIDFLERLRAAVRDFAMHGTVTDL